MPATSSAHLNQLHARSASLAAADSGTPEGRAYYFNRVAAQNLAAIDSDASLATLAAIESLPSNVAHTFESLGFAFAAIGRCIEAQSSVMFGGAS